MKTLDKIKEIMKTHKEDIGEIEERNNCTEIRFEVRHSNINTLIFFDNTLDIYVYNNNLNTLVYYNDLQEFESAIF